MRMLINIDIYESMKNNESIFLIKIETKNT